MFILCLRYRCAPIGWAIRDLDLDYSLKEDEAALVMSLFEAGARGPLRLMLKMVVDLYFTNRQYLLFSNQCIHIPDLRGAWSV